MMVEINKDEISIYISALNNASGYPMQKDIESEIGFTRKQINDLIQKLLTFKYVPTKDDLPIIISSLRVCLKYIDAWEFPATFDHEKEEIQKFYDQLNKQDFGKKSN